jgi:hypothetical protein
MEIQQQISCGISMIMGRGRDAGGTNRTERAREPGATAESATFLTKVQITQLLRGPRSWPKVYDGGQSRHPAGAPVSFSRGNGLTLESTGRSGSGGPVQRRVRA